MRSALIRMTVAAAVVLLAGACASTKYVPEGETLLDHVRVKTVAGTARDVNTAQLRNYVRQTPNARWFSAFRLPLATYSLAGRDTTKWVNRLLRSLGEPPVVYDSVLAQQTCSDLKLQLQNEGYLHAQVALETRVKGKKRDVTYLLKPGDPYFVRSISYVVEDSAIARLLNERGDSARRLLQVGMKFDVARLDAERKRITQLLTDEGYMRFHKEFIGYRADTARGSRLIDLTLRLGPYSRASLELADTLHTRYYVRRIGYSGAPATAAGGGGLHLRHHVLQENTFIAAGEPYSATRLQDTYNHFGRLQAVKYTSITFNPVAGTDSLDCEIQLQTNKPSTLSFEPEGTNTAGDLGAAASLTYQNRNLFHGSEVLSVQLRGAYEAIRGLEGYGNQDFVEWSVESRLAFPRFIMPGIGTRLRRKMNASSELSLRYDLQDRPEFHRRVLSAAWRYKWGLPQSHGRYQLDLLDLNYVFMPWISQTFRTQYLDDETSRNAILRYNYENLFITKIGFGYTYNNGVTALKTNVETSGNTLGLASSIFGAQQDASGHNMVMGIAYAQYAKADVDLTHALRFDPNNQLVLHLGFGIAYPYGNSTVLPFEKRYFSGGANSVRGWSVRSLGPGRYKEKDGNINFINQTGDMKLDLNVEYRTHLFWKLGGALFVDAGNVWTLRQYEEQPGGRFLLSSLLSDLAVSYGLGLRFNFDYFILRFDLGMKAVNPAFREDAEQHYPLLHPRFSRDYAFHFAVGLPF